MKVSYVTDLDVSETSTRTNRYPQAMGHWGRCYYIAKSIQDKSIDVQYFEPLTSKHTVLQKIKGRLYRQIIHKTYHPWAEPTSNKYLANQILKQLSILNPDVVLSPDVNLISYLDYPQPIVLWVDTLYAGLIDFYTEYSNLCRESIQHLTDLDKRALNKCKLVILSSEWAAQTAIKTYQVDPAKIKIIPSGANLECSRTLNDINALIEARPSERCKLIFLGVDWFRKGGDVALQIVNELNKRGLKAELTVIGCQPITDEPLPDFVFNLDFISKSSKQGLDKINTLISESHFLILLSRAETYGNVLCEANSFGVPCIVTDVGGMPTVIKNDINGKVFSLSADISEYCTYLADLFSNYSQYKDLALSSFNEYETRLNWSVAGQTAKNSLMDLI